MNRIVQVAEEESRLYSENDEGHCVLTSLQVGVSLCQQRVSQ